MAALTEQQIVDAVRRGDQSALGDLLQTYQHRIFNTCLRMVSNRDDAAEVSQETMLKIVEHIGDFHGQSEVGTWITRIAINLSISHLRKRRLRHTTSLDGTYPNGEDQATAL